MAYTILLTSNFQIQYDPAEYPGPGEISAVQNRATTFEGGCEPDYAVLCDWFGVAVGAGLGQSNRVVVTLTKSVRGGSNFGYSTSNPQMSVNPELGASSDDRVLGIFVAEMIEILMSFKGPWNPRDSGGEGLSRVAAQLLHPQFGNGFIKAWLAGDPTLDPSSAVADSEFRKDWVSQNFTGGPLKAGGSVNGDDDSYSYGCAMLFIYYLKSQLGFSVPQIVQNGGTTLADTYQKLTGRTDAFSRFSDLLAQKFPPGEDVPDLPSDNPFPILVEEADRGSFNTTDVRPWDEPQLKNGALISFAQPFSAAPGLPLGLAEIDMDRGAGIRISTTTALVTKDNFQIYIDSWADSVLYSGGCAWIEAPPESSDFQWGEFNTQEDRPWNQPQASTIRQITFPRPYEAPPSVVVWLNELDMGSSAGWRINAYATNISQTGFTLHIDTWADSVLYSAGDTWIAHSANNPNIASGAFNTQDVRPWDQPRPDNSNAIGFPHGFSSAPKVTVALNSIDIDNAAGLRISATTSGITSTGMTWHLDSWADTILYSAGGAYIAQA